MYRPAYYASNSTAMRDLRQLVIIVLSTPGHCGDKIYIHPSFGATLAQRCHARNQRPQPTSEAACVSKHARTRSFLAEYEVDVATYHRIGRFHRRVREIGKLIPRLDQFYAWPGQRRLGVAIVARDIRGGARTDAPDSLIAAAGYLPDFATSCLTSSIASAKRWFSVLIASAFARWIRSPSSLALATARS